MSTNNVNVLGYSGRISGYTDINSVGHYIVIFDGDHSKTCYYIGSIFKITNYSSYKNFIDWNKLLLKLYLQDRYYPENSGSVLFPNFYTKDRVRSFILALNTQLRIIIR